MSLDEALELVRHIERALNGYHLALAGSTLMKGEGADVDVLVYPRCENDYDPQDVRRQLSDAGLRRVHGPVQVWAEWRKKGSRDTKVVEVWRTFEGIKVDVFFPYEDGSEWIR